MAGSRRAFTLSRARGPFERNEHWLAGILALVLAHAAPELARERLRSSSPGIVEPQLEAAPASTTFESSTRAWPSLGHRRDGTSAAWPFSLRLNGDRWLE